MYQPVATYRLQFHKEFSFTDLERIIPYLRQLGVTTIYASPVFQSTPGSTHGYDGVNPHIINPEIGTEEQLRAISKTLHHEGISWLQDIVPNHMAFHPLNAWLMDVMETGKGSHYAPFFDIIWENGEGKIMVPFLGFSLEEVVEKGELQIAFENDRFVFKYYDSIYPLNDATQTQLKGNGGEWFRAVNADKKRLLEIAEQQHYRLCHWQETDHKINFRRFFTINGLICLNIQDKSVFEEYHRFIKQLVDDDIIQGLRIDHIDGLYDPTKYLEDLTDIVGENGYVVVEKILHHDEDLPKYWAVKGNTGYDFLAMVNNLFTNRSNEKKFTEFYNSLTGDNTPVAQQIRAKKAHILHEHMNGELDNLVALFKASDLAETSAIDTAQLRQAIGEILVECPVYRFYGNSMPLNAEEEQAMSDLLNGVKERLPELEQVLSLLRYTLLEKTKEGDEGYNKRVAHFYMRCMQFSGPLMAKGVEDTLMYTYNRFAGHNDVGDAPEAFGISPEGFHKKMMDRQKNWPLSLNATSTHDTKRGEDVRARLNVLTDLGDEWLRKVHEWRSMNAGLKKDNAPDSNDEYFIYQTITGAYPMPGMHDDQLEARLKEYLQKALREAKIHSSWNEPNEAYEQAAIDFTTALLKDGSAFMESFKEFHQRVCDHGIVSSLSQLLLKFTCPGVPDVYQGTELWDLSLVDPDNRRPVDYEERQRVLQTVEDKNDETFLSNLWQQRYYGDIKLWLTQLLLKERNNNKQLFSEGKYVALKAEGRYKDNIFAFARRYQQTWYLVIIPLHIAQLCNDHDTDAVNIDWRNTRVTLREEMPGSYTHVVGSGEGKASKEIYIRDVFKSLPFAILKFEGEPNDRSAGILLSLTSLPSPFGMGDMGHEAYAFADFLSKSKQKYWQLLPLTPTEAGAGHSPYSSYSSMAGNPLLISLEELIDDGLLNAADVDEYLIEPKAEANYGEAERIKDHLFDIAYNNFRRGRAGLYKEFDAFCEQEAYWLDDMAAFTVLKQQHNGKPWYEWEEQYRKKEQAVLDQFVQEHADMVRKTKFLQFLFLRQWKKLRAYCKVLGVQLFGDMPFYVSYDSVDVWANRNIFCLDDEGRMTGVAGVPPDYFSEDGQLWGMPTFNWSALKKDNYKWWVQRLKKNLELFDLLRIDHFRALQDYWQVPANAPTARTGEWIPGPREEFFQVMEKELGTLPFVAEDLGDKMEEVYVLRDNVGLPGMKVLQFAWGDNMPQSVDIPHNYQENCIVYTGTHDNNTTVGWYREETNSADHERMHHYLGLKVKKKNIHEVLARMAYASIARIAILPMQDILGLDASSRMNTPGQGTGNWLWRMEKGMTTSKLAAKLRDWVATFNRG